MRIILNNLTAIVMDGAPPVNVVMIEIIEIAGERRIRRWSREKTAGAIFVIAPVWSRQMV
jgi:hypothetical protein